MFSCLAPLASFVASGLFAQPQQTIQSPAGGVWETPFQHDLTGFPPLLPRFNAVHLSLIPRGSQRGKVLVFDLYAEDTQPEWKQRWAIVDVDGVGGPQFQNGILSLPAGEGDFFCAGHSWTSDGNLFVAGGTSQYPGSKLLHPSSNGKFIGGKLTYLWDPEPAPMGSWVRQPNMAVDRWYPSVTNLPDGRLLVAGGTETTESDIRSDNDYEVFRTTTKTRGEWETNGSSTLFAGPSIIAPLSIYPRLFQLSTGQQFLGGMTGRSSRLDHFDEPGRWTPMAHSRWEYRSYGSPVLMPLRPDAFGNYRDEVWLIGGICLDIRRWRSLDGDFGLSDGVSDTLVEACLPGSDDPADWKWTARPSLNHGRSVANAVILADGTLFLVGGRAGYVDSAEVPVRQPEVFDGLSWTSVAPQATVRSYHSTAVLLPSGKVLSAGGDSSNFDYQVFVPAYLTAGLPRPRVTSAPRNLGYSSEDVFPRDHRIEFEALPAGHQVARAVLVSAGSVTHHCDVNQRSIELVSVASEATALTVRAPRDANLAPPGYYMLFLLTERGIPSHAEWVRVASQIPPVRER